MDAKTVESLGGKITKVIVSYDRKVWRDKKGSVGGSVSAEVSVGTDADADAVVNAVYDWLKEAHKRNTEAVMRDVIQSDAESSPEQPPLPPPAPASSPTAAPVPPPAPAPASEVNIVTLDAPTCAHVFDQGEHRFKVFGGAWKKFGVSAYPEVLAMYNIVGWESWPICKISRAGAEPLNHFALPGGFQRVEVEVKDNKPQRVHSFK